jgi:hypothetical protein
MSTRTAPWVPHSPQAVNSGQTRQLSHEGCDVARRSPCSHTVSTWFRPRAAQPRSRPAWLEQVVWVVPKLCLTRAHSSAFERRWPAFTSLSTTSSHAHLHGLSPRTENPRAHSSALLITPAHSSTLQHKAFAHQTEGLGGQLRLVLRVPGRRVAEGEHRSLSPRPWNLRGPTRAVVDT